MGNVQIPDRCLLIFCELARNLNHHGRKCQILHPRRNRQGPGNHRSLMLFIIKFFTLFGGFSSCRNFWFFYDHLVPAVGHDGLLFAFADFGLYYPRLGLGVYFYKRHHVGFDICLNLMVDLPMVQIVSPIQ
jgi:hypothetical protein